MPFTFNINIKKQLVELNGYDRVKRDDIIETMTAVLFDPVWKNGYHVIVDLDQADLSALTTRDLEVTIAYQEEYQNEYKKSRIAIVAGNDREYGIARMWEMMGSSEIMNVMIFRTRQDAFNWLEIEHQNKRFAV